HAVRGLEESLGVALFAREGRSVRLTAEGEALMRHVKRGFGELQLGIGSVSCEDMVYTGHWLVFPRAKRSSRGIRLFAEWLAAELTVSLNLDG
ncbi:MAG: LysR family transcriptional regulator, partial [Acetobacteraceae bacterium]|nr:LysR family transcriptional regulator [Acetobacteraceae bacterium]